MGFYLENGELESTNLNNEKQNCQQDSIIVSSTSENSSIEIPARKVKVEIEYKLLKNGIVIYECKMCPTPKFFTNFKSLCDHFENHDIFVFPFFSMCKKCKKDTAHQDLNENDFKEHFCQEIEKQPTIDSNVENSNSPETESINQLSENSERSVQLNENKNSQQESNLFYSESSSIQIPVRKKMHVRQARVDIEYSIQEKVNFSGPWALKHYQEKGTLEKGILFGCKMCLRPRVFTNFQSFRAHFKTDYRNYIGFTDYESRYEHFKRHEGIFLIAMCRKCKNESVYPDLIDLNEDSFKEHSCQEIEIEPTKGQEI